MPNAVGNNDTERHPLKSLEGGFVELRRMTYGEYVKRRQMLSGMRLEGKGKNAEAVMQLANEKVTQFEFAKCIVDHNLEDGNGRKLNLKSPKDFSRLDPRIGQEIGNRIDDMNQFQDEDEDGNPDTPVDDYSDDDSDDSEAGGTGN